MAISLFCYPVHTTIDSSAAHPQAIFGGCDGGASVLPSAQA